MTLNLWFLEVATLFCFDNCFTNTLHSVYKFHQIITRYVFPAFLQQFPEMYGTGGLFRFRSSVQFLSPIPALSDWDPLTGEARSLFWDIGNFPFSSNICCTNLMYVLGRYLFGKGRISQPAVNLMELRVSAVFCDSHAGSGYHELKTVCQLFHQQNIPRPWHYLPPCLSVGTTHVELIRSSSLSRKYSAVWPKYFEFGLIRP